MLKLKLVLALLLSGIISVLIALFTDGMYRRWIQTLYLHYPATKIRLYGKGFYLFTSTPIIVSTAIAGMTITFLLYKQSWKTWLSQLLLLPMVFIISTVLSTWIDATVRLARCNTCAESGLALGRHEINYDLHLAIGLGIGLVLMFGQRRRKNQMNSSKS